MSPFSSSKVVFLGDLPLFLSRLTGQQTLAHMGELLYPLVEQLEPRFAPKITGMILELDQNRIFHLMDSPKALKETLKEAIEVLKDWIPQQLQQLEKEAPLLSCLTCQQKLAHMGELLYLLVEQLEPHFAPKITGMILELDQDRLLHLLDSPDALKETVKEAIEILKDWILQQMQQLDKEDAWKLLNSMISKL